MYDSSQEECEKQQSEGRHALGNITLYSVVTAIR